MPNAQPDFDVAAIYRRWNGVEPSRPPAPRADGQTEIDIAAVYRRWNAAGREPRTDSE